MDESASSWLNRPSLGYKVGLVPWGATFGFAMALLALWVSGCGSDSGAAASRSGSHNCYPLELSLATQVQGGEVTLASGGLRCGLTLPATFPGEGGFYIVLRRATGEPTVVAQVTPNREGRFRVAVRVGIAERPGRVDVELVSNAFTKPPLSRKILRCGPNASCAPEILAGEVNVVKHR